MTWSVCRRFSTKVLLLFPFECMIIKTMKKINLLSTVVVPSFKDCFVLVKGLNVTEFLDLLKDASANYCGHPLTWQVLAPYVPNLAPAERGKFWDGEGIGIAARPKGGVRVATQNGDTEVTLDDLEFVYFEIAKSVAWGYEGLGKPGDMAVDSGGTLDMAFFTGPYEAAYK